MKGSQITKHQFYCGWAMEAYPEMSEDDFYYHVQRQLRSGTNFLWIGHNNPGEVYSRKREPAISYAVYAAFIDKTHPRHKTSTAIVEAQHRLLRVCQELRVPVVFPVGYQIQMGRSWNQTFKEHLRRDFTGRIIDWGGVSACFYSPQYQEDIQKLYGWIVENFISKYKEVILMVNLADEPFGGDYSYFAQEAFRNNTGWSFKQAIHAGDEGLTKLGQFQANYVVEYAGWSARAWQKVCPGIPATMSFCGHHGREGNVLPSVPELFSQTPDNFQPTFDVYPRDGPSQKPVKEEDITSLIVLLRQLAYLSRKHHKPYWLWTTGNSWGLGQASADKANISDAMANQLYTFSTAREWRALLQGIAIWNYNCREQGLYNDTNPIIYNPDEMFERLTRLIAIFPDMADEDWYQLPEIAIIRERDYGLHMVGQSRESTWVRPFHFHHLYPLVKTGKNFVVEDDLDQALKYYRSSGAPLPKLIIILGDGRQSGTQLEKINGCLDQGSVLVIPEQLANVLPAATNNIVTYPADPEHLKPEIVSTALKQARFALGQDTFHFRIGDAELVYNLNHCDKHLRSSDRQRVYPFELNGQLKTREGNARAKISHHQMALVCPPNNNLLGRFI